MATEAASESEGMIVCRIFTKDALELSLAIEDGVVVLKPNNPLDEHQQWIVEDKYGSISKDDAGSPGFAIVNRATRLAIQHSTGDKRLVQVVPYKSNYFNETVLWTKGKIKDEDEYTSLRVVYDLKSNLYALPETKDTGIGGRLIGLSQWNGGANQYWKIAEHGDAAMAGMAAVLGVWLTATVETLVGMPKEKVTTSVNEVANELADAVLTGSPEFIRSIHEQEQAQQKN